MKLRIRETILHPHNWIGLRHWRGHSIHSPFAYNLVREALMRCKITDKSKHALYDELRQRGFSKRCAVQLQNVYTHCGYRSWFFADRDKPNIPNASPAVLCIALPSLSDLQTAVLTRVGEKFRTTICIISPCRSRERYRLTRKIISAHQHTSIENRRFILLFNNPRLPKQHFRL